MTSTMKRVMAATGENRVLAVGLMSGTSLDGVDAALIETDGERVTRYRAGRLPEVEWVEACG